MLHHFLRFRIKLCKTPNRVTSYFLECSQITHLFLIVIKPTSQVTQVMLHCLNQFQCIFLIDMHHVIKPTISNQQVQFTHRNQCWKICMFHWLILLLNLKFYFSLWKSFIQIIPFNIFLLFLFRISLFLVIVYLVVLFFLNLHLLVSSQSHLNWLFHRQSFNKLLQFSIKVKMDLERIWYLLLHLFYRYFWKFELLNGAFHFTTQLETLICNIICIILLQ